MSELQAQAGCSKRCLDSDVESCVNGWPDGSCGARPQGTQWPKDVRTRTTKIPHLGLILKIIRLGLTGRQDGVKAYTELLADHVEESGDGRTAVILRQYSKGEFGAEVKPV